jgi:hypothetical protein
MRSFGKGLLAALAIVLLQTAHAADPPKAGTPLGAEILAFEGALTAEAVPGWAAQRATWARLVAEAKSAQVLATSILTLEQSMGWETVEPTWKARRPGWATEAQRAASMAAVAKLLMDLEGHTRWAAVREPWKKDRDAWVRRVSAIALPASAAPQAAAKSAPAAATSAGAAAVSAEMADFLSGFNGDYKAVKAALKKHAAGGLDDKDMGIMNLAQPKVTASEIKAGRQCYTFDAQAGITVRSFGVCWEGARIVAVEDKGMR